MSRTLSASEFNTLMDALKEAGVKSSHIVTNDSPEGHKVWIGMSDYPEDRYELYRKLASVEIELRDAGIPVHLYLDYQQRLLVVVAVAGKREVALLSHDGDVLSDVAKLLGNDELAESATVDTYAYDSTNEIDIVIQEAKADHPDADFSRIAA